MEMHLEGLSKESPLCSVQVHIQRDREWQVFV
jgi:hypothetical protein